MTSRALRYSPTLSQSCSGHKVNIRHQRAARVTAFPVSILQHPAPPLPPPSLPSCAPSCQKERKDNTDNVCGLTSRFTETVKECARVFLIECCLAKEYNRKSMQRAHRKYVHFASGFTRGYVTCKFYISLFIFFLQKLKIIRINSIIIII